MSRRLALRLLPPLGAGLVVVVAAMFLLFYVVVPFHPGASAGRSPAAPSNAPATSPLRPLPHRAPPPTPTPTPSGPSLVPVRLVVPAAQVNAAVETVGLTQGAIGVPSQAMDAAWYDGSVAPGQPGNAILDGHVDWWTGPGVFGHLAQVRVGDQVQLVRTDGSQVTFAVTGQQIFGANDQVPATMLAKTGPATLSLITCTGSWDGSEYSERLVINASLS